MKSAEDTLRPLLLLGLDGDNAAYAAFLVRASAHLRAYFRRRMTDWPDDVEDLMQETLLALHNQRHTYRPAEPLTAWLHAIARYKLVDALRARSVRMAVLRPLDEDAEAVVAESAPEGGSARRDLALLLAELPERMRRPIECVKLEGLSMAEAAARTGMSVAAIKVGVHRGLKLLARKARGEA